MVLQAPGGAALAGQWYHATIASLQNDRNYASLLPHLDAARTTMPADRWIWLQSGAAYENLAAPAVQAAVEEAGSSARVEAPAILLARAEIMLRRAMEMEPDNGQVRLRLGRVLDIGGRHQEAAAMLAAEIGRAHV